MLNAGIINDDERTSVLKLGIKIKNICFFNKKGISYLCLLA